MDRFEAHGRLCLRPDAGLSLLPEGIDQVVAPLMGTALASMSGILRCCVDDEDLDRAVEAGLDMIRTGDKTHQDFHKEVRLIQAELDRWVQKIEAATIAN